MKNNFIKSTSMIIFLLITFHAYSVPKLNSFPSAPATIFLDFDGYYLNSAFWNVGEPLVCGASGMTDAQMTECFDRVSEDYRPFNINITTDSAVYEMAPLDKRIRIVVTITSDWYPGVGGVAYIGSFVWGDDTPGFVFSAALGYSPKMVGEACSHESGHSLGLAHQSKWDAGCNLTEVYNSGIGSGVTSWAPIMGNSYYRNMSGWQKGPTPYDCGETQDNISILTTQNGFTYRSDDYDEILYAKTTTVNPVSFAVNGIISTETDKDAFRFVLSQNSKLRIDANPFSAGANNTGANLDIKLMLYNSLGVLVKAYDPVSTMSANIDTTLNSGTYYLKIDGTGNANASDYGSLGSYTISGYTATVLPIRSIVLSGNAENNQHNLKWNIVSDEPAKSIVLESSADGINFNKINEVNGSTLSSKPFSTMTNYYRLKVVSVMGETAYSNIIALKGFEQTSKQFNITTLVKNEIVINSPANFQYQLMDMNGRILEKGQRSKGLNRLDLTNQPIGMYVIQLITNTNKQTERIVKY